LSMVASRYFSRYFTAAYDARFSLGVKWQATNIHRDRRLAIWSQHPVLTPRLPV
jgi:hypothetical protein